MSSEAYMIVISDHVSLAEVLSRQIMGFRDSVKETPKEGDSVAIYTTRGCFGNPTKDEAQIVAIGKFASPIECAQVSIAGQSYQRSATLSLTMIAVPRHALPFRPLVSNMDFITSKKSWSAYVHRTVVPITNGDFACIRNRLEEYSNQP